MTVGGYEMVIGLEVHVELKTRTKIFCGCRTDFDAPPNTHCCPVCLGLPGALPVLNREVVRYATRAGLALHCAIAGECGQDRKHYFYPDLPKAYQVSQHRQPLCGPGYLDIETGADEKRIGITRIHIEEDAGKLLHGEALGTRIDFNRCGVPLIELVTEPDLRSAAQAKAFLQKLRAILLCVDVSDCRMDEGSMRCDVNLSVRRAGDVALGTRTEVKNLNSFGYTVKAIEAEFARQVDVLRSGGTVVQESRRFDPATGLTHAMRAKESMDDYRFFPDPDLPPIRLDPAQIDALRAALPELPDAKKARFQQAYGLSAYEAGTLCASTALCAAFEAAAPLCHEPKRLWTLFMGEVARMHDGDAPLPLRPEDLAALSDLLTDGVIHPGNVREVLQALTAGEGTPHMIVEARGLAQVSDRAALCAVIDEVLAQSEPLVRKYLAGKEKALQAIMGRVMAQTRGRANPTIAAELLREKINAKRG